ncbi:glycosyltransferase family 2 protein [Thalassomonas actiniarum]|uniref:Glycosyltransferase n=1 Tax=Thalassomonas actiniarum TaxID=485447 RepID=A0AAE9YWW0_9GAMM|nr:glycosyltransferase [Thalassomonas actiniarum]WDE00968.1 glycosyltransferase [Thalassomonas actiniarum]
MYSVIIPTFNRCALLKQAIDSVLLQQVRQIEIIVVDDGSTDDTALMLAEKYPKVRYFYQENKGPGAARNKGILQSKGDYIALLDSDDIWLENKINHEMKLFQQFPEAEMLAGNASGFLEGELRRADIFSQRKINFPQKKPRFFEWSLPIMKLGPVCNTSTMTFKRATLEKMGSTIFDESLRFDEDWDLEFRLFAQFKALLYPEVNCHVHIFNDQTRLFYSAQGQEKTNEEWRNIWQQQILIINRYLNKLYWDMNIAKGFELRIEQLGQLLKDAGG